MLAANINKLRESGFSFIEILVTLLIFWLGLVGIAMFTVGGLKVFAGNQVRATAIKAASMVTEPLSYHSRPDCLAVMLATFPRTVMVDNDKDSYQISLVQAVDGGGATVASGTLTTTTIAVASANWVSPVSITLRVPYSGLDGTIITATPNYTIVLQNYLAACNA